jgi:hypothetical protein
MSLPYENATSGKAAIGQMQKLLKGFGAASFGTMEDFAAGKVIVQFEYRERRVTIEASFKGYAAAWLRHHPYKPSRMRLSRSEYEKRAINIAEVAVWSILRDWLKGQLTAVAVGMVSFEGAFLGALLLKDGRTVMQAVESAGIIAIEDQRGD